MQRCVWVRVHSGAPARRKRYVACDELFHFIAKLIARSFCCSSLPNRTRCRWAPVWGRSSSSPAFQFFVNSSDVEHLFYSWSSILLLSFSVNLFPSTFFLSQSGKLDLRPSSLPSISASSSQATYRLRRVFSFHCKAHRALILPLLAPKPRPAAPGFDAAENLWKAPCRCLGRMR